MFLNNVNMVQTRGGFTQIFNFCRNKLLAKQKKTHLFQSYVKLLNQFKTPKITEIFKMQLAVGI